MTRPTKAQRIDAARNRHYANEIARFGLRPWEMPPVLATEDTPPDGVGPWAASWARARELRAELLRANPAHYDDLR